jgi:uncharacterized protein CbrC (UPF0167 family)
LLDEDVADDVTTIVQLLRDNLTFWSEEIWIKKTSTVNVFVGKHAVRKNQLWTALQSMKFLSSL